MKKVFSRLKLDSFAFQIFNCKFVSAIFRGFPSTIKMMPTRATTPALKHTLPSLMSSLASFARREHSPLFVIAFKISVFFCNYYFEQVIQILSLYLKPSLSC